MHSCFRERRNPAVRNGHYRRRLSDGPCRQKVRTSKNVIHGRAGASADERFEMHVSQRPQTSQGRAARTANRAGLAAAITVFLASHPLADEAPVANLSALIDSRAAALDLPLRTVESTAEKALRARVAIKAGNYSAAHD